MVVDSFFKLKYKISFSKKEKEKILVTFIINKYRKITTDNTFMNKFLIVKSLGKCFPIHTLFKTYPMKIHIIYQNKSPKIHPFYSSSYGI